MQSQYNGRLYETRESYEKKLRSSQRNDQQLYNTRASYTGPTKLMPPPQCNGYVSTDESEYTTDETTDSSDEIDDYPREIAGSMDRGSSAPSALFNCCDSSEYSIAFDDEYNATASNRRRSTTSQELETLYEMSKEPDARFVNTETEIPPEAKSLMLSMIASQEDILETKKHLRSTPVLDNLVGTATPEYKLDDANPELGKLTRMRFSNLRAVIASQTYRTIFNEYALILIQQFFTADTAVQLNFTYNMSNVFATFM